VPVAAKIALVNVNDRRQCRPHPSGRPSVDLTQAMSYLRVHGIPRERESKVTLLHCHR